MNALHNFPKELHHSHIAVLMSQKKRLPVFTQIAFYY